MACVVAPVSDSQFEQVKLYTGELGLMVNTENPLAKKEKLNINDLAGETIISSTDMPDSAFHIDTAIYERGAPFKPLKQTFSLKSGFATVESNLASVFIDVRRKDQIHSDKIKVLEFDEESKLFYSLLLIWKKGRKLSEPCERFKKYLISKYR